MDLSRIIFKDPVTGLASVSFTLLIISFLLVVTACVMEMFNIIHTTSLISELYFANVGLYFGRRISTKAGNVVGEIIKEGEK